jgi:hypothetical protein
MWKSRIGFFSVSAETTPHRPLQKPFAPPVAHARITGNRSVFALPSRSSRNAIAPAAVARSYL